MTRKEKQKAIDALKKSAPVMTVTQEEFNDYIQTLNKVMNWLEQEPCDFAKWVATEIFDEWEYKKDSFAEIACRKLAKLGIVRAKGDEWELVEPQERSEE